jgi:hypothetical protein
MTSVCLTIIRLNHICVQCLTGHITSGSSMYKKDLIQGSFHVVYSKKFLPHRRFEFALDALTKELCSQILGSCVVVNLSTICYFTQETPSILERPIQRLVVTERYQNYKYGLLKLEGARVRKSVFITVGYRGFLCTPWSNRVSKYKKSTIP